MAEVRFDVEITHSPGRVWRALTDARVLEQCVMPGGWVITAGAGFRLHPPRDLGMHGPVDVEVLHVDAGQRLVMQWTGPRLYSEVTWALTPSPAGCRVSVVQTGFLGTPQARRTHQLRAAYHHGFGQRLPRILTPGADQPPLNRPARRGARPGAALAAVRGVGDPRRWLRASAARTVAGALAAAAVLAAIPVLTHHAGIFAVPAPNDGLEAPPVTVLPAGTDARGSTATATSSPTRTRAGDTPTRKAARAAQETPSQRGPAPTGNGASQATAGGTQSTNPSTPSGQVTATYQTTKAAGNGNYQGQITLTAAGGTATSWVIQITLPTGSSLTHTSGAVVAASGTTVRFTPADNAAVSPQHPVIFTFTVHKPSGANHPLTCTANGQPCAGIPG